MEQPSQPQQQININLEDVWKILVERSQSDKELALHLEVATHAAIAQNRATQLTEVETKMRDHLNSCVTNTPRADDPVWPTTESLSGQVIDPPDTEA